MLCWRLRGRARRYRSWRRAPCQRFKRLTRERENGQWCVYGYGHTESAGRGTRIDRPASACVQVKRWMRWQGARCHDL
jgi:hypothetical protein